MRHGQATRRTGRVQPSKATGGPARIVDLLTHQEPFITVGELAEYWLVSRKQIYKQIDAGILHAIKLGPRLLRISTAEAIAFERRAILDPANPVDEEKSPASRKVAFVTPNPDSGGRALPSHGRGHDS